MTSTTKPGEPYDQGKRWVEIFFQLILAKVISSLISCSIETGEKVDETPKQN